MNLTPLQVEVLTYLGATTESVEVWRMLLAFGDGNAARRKDGAVMRRRWTPVLRSLANDEFILWRDENDTVTITALGREALSEYAFGGH